MSQTTADGPPRQPKPWWVRLIVWIVVLAMLVTAVALTIQSSTYGATTHTTSSASPSAQPGEPAASVSQVAAYGPDAHLAGSVVAEIDGHGVIARDALTGDRRWQYTRSDSDICAQQTTSRHIVLLYKNGQTCSEAIALDPESGARKWQRTLEAAGDNRIVFNEAGFLSIDKQKMIVYESTQGYERFTLDNSRGQDVEGEQSTCENLDAAGQTMVATLQRCRSASDAPWVLHIVVNTPSDGKPREAGRSYLTGLDSPSLIGVTPDGTTFVRDSAGAVSTYAVGAQNPSSVAGLPALAEGAQVLGERGTVVVSDGASAYGLDRSRSSVAWSEPLTAPPSQFGVTFYIPTASGIQLRRADNGELLRTVALPAPGASESVTVSGQLVGVRGADGLTIYR